MGVAPSRIFSSTFSLLYNLLNNYVTDPIASTRNKTQGNTKWVFAAFPDSDITDGKIKYPIIIIEPANASWIDWTFTKNVAAIRLSFTIYASSMEQADNLFDQCVSVMDQQRDYLRSNGLTFLVLESTDSDFIVHGSTRVHFRNATYASKYYFSSGISKKQYAQTIASNGEVA